MYMALTDFEKAFDIIETWALLKALKRCRIDDRYIQLIGTICNKRLE